MRSKPAQKPSVIRRIIDAFRADAEQHSLTDTQFMLGEAPVGLGVTDDLAVLAAEIVRHEQMAATSYIGPRRDAWIAKAAALQRCYDRLV